MPNGRPPFPLVALVILDGWGCAPPGPGNAVELASTPVFDALWSRYPHTTLRASGEDVGLPPGQMGNSEVGHLTIGSGRVIFQDLMRVNRAIDEEVMRIINESYEEAKRLLVAHRRELDALVEALLSRETLNEQEILDVTGLPPAPALDTGLLPVSDAG